MSYISKDKLQAYGLVGKLIRMTRRLDLYSYRDQVVVSKKRSESKTAIHFSHKYEMMFFEFIGFGDLFGQEATLYSGSIVISSGFIGINNDVSLYYQNPLPRSGVAITVAMPDESSFY